MPAAARPCAMASAALAAASVVAVTPIAPRPAQLPILSQATRLIAGGESLLNVPLNLFYDIVNIPYYELEAVDFGARSLFNSGTWWVASPTNLWGVDPGDPSHFMSIVNFLFPNPALSGMNSPELDFSAGLGQQLWGMMAALLPTSSGCDAMGCAPAVPMSPITGVTGIDTFGWLAKMSLGQEKFPLLNNWFQVSFNQLLNGYYFDPSFDGSTDPSGTAFDIPGIGFPGTGAGDAMPWSGMTYTLEPWVPIQNFINSLMAAPATDGFAGTGLYIPTFGEIGRDFQSLLAALVVAFDPFTPGSPLCLGGCSIITNAGLDYPQLVQDINNVWPGNPLIQDWLTAYADGTANVPSQAIIDRSIQLLTGSFWDFGNPPPPDGYNLGGFDPSTLAPFFHQFWTDLGFVVPPLADPGSYASSAADLSAILGPLASILPADLLSGAAVNPLADFGAIAMDLLNAFTLGAF